jgi:hypothetical protein
MTSPERWKRKRWATSIEHVTAGLAAEVAATGYINVVSPGQHLLDHDEQLISSRGQDPRNPG